VVTSDREKKMEDEREKINEEIKKIHTASQSSH
jgi:hypothetical protein